MSAEASALSEWASAVKWTPEARGESSGQPACMIGSQNE